MERFFWLTLFLLSYIACTILLLMDGAVVEHDYQWTFEAIGIIMATLLAYFAPVGDLLRDYILNGTGMEQHFAKLCNPVGPLMGIGVAFALDGRKDDTVGPYLYWILLTAVFSIFSAIVLLRPVATDFGLFYTFCAIFVNFSIKEFHKSSWETYCAVGICVALVLSRALLEYFAVCARKKATAAAASTAVDAAIPPAAAKTTTDAVIAAAAAKTATDAAIVAAAIPAAAASTAADAAIPAAAASTAPAAAIPADAASTAPAAAIPAAAIPAAADATVASAVTSHEA